MHSDYVSFEKHLTIKPNCELCLPVLLQQMFEPPSDVSKCMTCDNDTKYLFVTGVFQYKNYENERIFHSC